jgi:hypothetical protein
VLKIKSDIGSRPIAGSIVILLTGMLSDISESTFCADTERFRKEKKMDKYSMVFILKLVF